MAFEGGCLCGSIRYVIERKYLNAAHCYCGMCRKAHGTAFSTHAVTRPDQLRWTNGETERAVFESSPDAWREFCPPLRVRNVLVHGQTGDGMLAIPVGTLDGDPTITVTAHIFTADRVSWYDIPDDGTPRFDGWPPGFGKD